MEEFEISVANVVSFVCSSFHDPTSSARAAVNPKQCSSSPSSDPQKQGWYVVLLWILCDELPQSDTDGLQPETLLRLLYLR